MGSRDVVNHLLFEVSTEVYVSTHRLVFVLQLINDAEPTVLVESTLS
jgi:hypothetical protein